MATDESNQCDYRLELGVTEADITTDPCERPVWEDHDRCIWHAPVDGKEKEELEETDPGSQDNIDGAYLRETSLGSVDWFEGTSMIGADFTGADLTGADFTGANLTLARFTDATALGTDFTEANLEGAILTNADFRRATLEHARLHETVLTDMHMGGGTKMGGVAIYDQENAPPDLIDEQPLEAAAWVYRQLQALYQDNALPELARQSYKLERDARRRNAWRQSEYKDAVKWELSRWVMRYGESPSRVLLTSLVVVVVAALVFPLTGGLVEMQGGQPVRYSIENPDEAPWWWLGRVLFKSLYFSVVTFATLGLGDIQPVGSFARLVAGVESILGSLLAALLVFVLARIVTW